METLSAELKICVCCGQPLDLFVQPLHPKSIRQPSTYGTCRNANCDRLNITREVNDLHTLTVDQILSFRQSTE